MGKIFLPLVGGSSSAWNNCMFFFQAMLMAGYLFTHFSATRFGVKKQLFIQFPLMLAVFIFLPFSVNYTGDIPANPSFWLIGRLFLIAGLPFFAVSAVSPLLQLWFAQTSHKYAKNPFFLFAAANAGSLIALAAYPAFFEPEFNLEKQAQLWSWGFAILFVLVFLCGIIACRSDSEDVIKKACGTQPGFKDIFKWVLFAFVPSSLMLAVTQYITTDLMPMPLFWVIPLMIYLLSFIFSFSHRFSFSSATLRKLSLTAIISFLSFHLFVDVNNFWLGVVVHLLILLLVSWYCHRYIYETRPERGHLTIFYAWVSFGGVLGGLFNSMIAPIIFNEFVEYPIMLVLVCYLADKYGKDQSDNRPAISNRVSAITGIYIFGMLFFISIVNFVEVYYNLAVYFGFDGQYSFVERGVYFIDNHTTLIRQILFITLALMPALIMRLKYRVRFAPMVAIALILLFGWKVSRFTIIHRERNFFGVKKVFCEIDQSIRYLAHGSTIHGKQSYQESWIIEPLSYYHRRGPLGDIFDLPVTAKENVNAAIIGLGIGSMAAYSRPGDNFVFFEIDPQIVEIAYNDNIFIYMKHFGDNCRVIVGDGRLKLAEQPEGHFDLIVVDAFSSDSIPLHLLTVEAMELYFNKLNDYGVVAVHVSNRYIDFKPHLKAIARQKNLKFAFISDQDFDRNHPPNFWRRPSEYAVFTKDQGVINYLTRISQGEWQTELDDCDYKAWTDNHSAIFPLIRIGETQGTVKK